MIQTHITNTDRNFHLYIVLKQFSDLISAHAQPDLNELNERPQPSVQETEESDRSRKRHKGE